MLLLYEQYSQNPNPQEQNEYAALKMSKMKEYILSDLG